MYLYDVGPREFVAQGHGIGSAQNRYPTLLRLNQSKRVSLAPERDDAVLVGHPKPALILGQRQQRTGRPRTGQAVENVKDLHAFTTPR